jgi:hypothetical protein
MRALLPRCPHLTAASQQVPFSPAGAIRFTYLCYYHCSYQRDEFILSSVIPTYIPLTSIIPAKEVVKK